MVAPPRLIKLDPENEFLPMLREAEDPAIIEAGGERFRVIREPSDIVADCDPAQALIALQGMFGTLPPEGMQELKSELRAMSDQNSTGPSF